MVTNRWLPALAGLAVVVSGACTGDGKPGPTSTSTSTSTASALPLAREAESVATAAYLEAEGRPLVTLTTHAKDIAANADTATCKRVTAALSEGPSPDQLLELALRVEDGPLREAFLAERKVTLEVLGQCAKGKAPSSDAVTRLGTIVTTVDARLAALGVRS